MARLILLFLLLGAASWAAEENRGIYNPLHGYFTQTPEDRFTRLNRALETGQRTLDTSGEIPMLLSLLRELDVPVSSQTLVFSVTSLQKGLISPRRPRALYFNDDTYVGFVPGGRLEVIATDPQLGHIFYIFDPLRGPRLPRASRSEDCMNCHAPHYLENVPGLVIESVIPGLTGGGERAFRRQQSGHGVPLEQRFGGWHLTGVGEGWPRLQGNLFIERRDGQAFEQPLLPGQLCDLSRYPLATSDLLPQLLQEHQVGFMNRALQAAYRTRELLHEKGEAAAAAEIEGLARPVVRYLLFADEAPLPAPVEGEPEFKDDFRANKRVASNGASLKDLDLATRLLRHRCSYMIYSPGFTGLPEPLKKAILRQVDAALGESTTPEYAYLPLEERRAIRTILRETLSDFPVATR